MSLDSACEKIKEDAEVNCLRCEREAEYKRTGKWARFVGSYSSKPPVKPDHTCHATIAAAREGMLAILNEEVEGNLTMRIVKQRRVRVEATIERLLGGTND